MNSSIPNIQVGTIAIATRASGVCDVGETGVCYEVYELARRPGYSFIFESGRHDGFSPEDVEMFLHVTHKVAPGVASYEFRNVTRLMRDFQEGRFADAFPPDHRTQQFRICPHCNEESIRQAQVATVEPGWEEHGYFCPNPPKRYIPGMTWGVTGLTVRPILPFLHVFLDDMDVCKIQINGGGAEPIMVE